MNTLELVTFIKYLKSTQDELKVIKHFTHVSNNRENIISFEGKMKAIRETIISLIEADALKKDHLEEIYTELQEHNKNGDVEILESNSIWYDEAYQNWKY